MTSEWSVTVGLAFWNWLPEMVSTVSPLPRMSPFWMSWNTLFEIVSFVLFSSLMPVPRLPMSEWVTLTPELSRIIMPLPPATAPPSILVASKETFCEPFTVTAVAPPEVNSM